MIKKELLPPAARNLFEKRFLDFQKLLIIKVFVGSRGGFYKKSPWPPEAKVPGLTNS
jgi:hypothetical protein